MSDATVVTHCTNCSKAIEFKSNIEEDSRYTTSLRIPISIAIDLDKQTQVCKSCGQLNELRAVSVPVAVLMLTRGIDG